MKYDVSTSSVSEALGLAIKIDPLIGMLRTMSNSLGDVVVSTIVIKEENLPDRSLYNKKPIRLFL